MYISWKNERILQEGDSGNAILSSKIKCIFFYISISLALLEFMLFVFFLLLNFIKIQLTDCKNNFEINLLKIVIFLLNWLINKLMTK